jgi:curved DNA-binding protein CbpA
MTLNRKFLDVLFDLHKNGRSGILRLEKCESKKQLVFKNGRLVFAESNLPDDHLARILISLSLMEKSKISDVAALMKRGKTSEEAITESAGIRFQDLQKGRLEQAIRITGSLLVWEKSGLRFLPGENPLTNRPSLEMSIPEIILLSARRAISEQIIKAPLDFFSRPLVISESGVWHIVDLPLGNAEYSVYSMLKEGMSLPAILSLIPSKDASASQIILLLYVLGFAEVKEEPKENLEEITYLEKLDEMLLSFGSANYYEILSIAPDADQPEVQSAYHERARQWHPDRFQSESFSDDIRRKAEQVFAKINEAYIKLRDSETRAAYDATRQHPEKKPADAVAQAPSPKESAEALYQEGRAALANSDFEGAVGKLKTCVWMFPDNASFNHYLAVAESENSRLRTSAEQHFLKAIELDGLSSFSRIALAKLYIKATLPRKAENQLQELLHFDPENSEAKKLLSELRKR